MKFATQYELQPGPEPWPEGREAQVYRDALDQLIYSEELGFDYAWVVEHHFLTGYSSSSAPETFLAWAAGQTETIRLGHGVIQFNNGANHIVRVAERTAALDIISNGRLDVGSGRGFTENEVVAFGVDPSQTRAMQAHGHRTLPKLWVEDEFELDDEFYKVPRRRLHPKPVQQPHPPLWMAVAQPASWEIAGKLGAGVLSFGFHAPDDHAESIAAYRRGQAQADIEYGEINDHIAFSITAFCAETDEEALETAAEHILYFIECNLEFAQRWAKSDAKDYEYYKKMGTDLLPLPELTEDEKAGLSLPAQVVKQGVKGGIFCVGSPETCRNSIRKHRDAGIDQIILNKQVGKLTNAQLKSSLKLFAEEVLPEFSDNPIMAAARV